MDLINQIPNTDEKLVRKWVFWVADAESNERSEQERIRNECTTLMDSITQSMTHIDDELRECILFSGRFYLSDSSLAPWTTEQNKKLSRTFVEKIINEYGKILQIEEILLDALETTLIEMKKGLLSNDINSFGYHHKTSKIKVGGKLIGNSYTKTLDKMMEFKQRHITSLGYLNILIQYTNVEKNWRIILPLMLSFLDDTDLLVKREATILLDSICNSILETNIHNNIILKSQTMPLFKTAIQPLLLALPSLTPEDKSVTILSVAYRTMFNLIKISIKDDLEYYKIMSALLNDTLLPSIGKCKDYIKVLDELLQILQDFLVRCGDFQIVLTKQVVYTLLTVLMDPYIAHVGTIVRRIISIIKSCLENVPVDRRGRFKYDVLGCMGTLRRRLTTIDNSPVGINIQIDSLIDFVSV